MKTEYRQSIDNVIRETAKPEIILRKIQEISDKYFSDSLRNNKLNPTMDEIEYIKNRLTNIEKGFFHSYSDKEVINQMERAKKDPFGTLAEVQDMVLGVDWRSESSKIKESGFISRELQTSIQNINSYFRKFTNLKTRIKSDITLRQIKLNDPILDEIYPLPKAVLIIPGLGNGATRYYKYDFTQGRPNDSYLDENSFYSLDLIMTSPDEKKLIKSWVYAEGAEKYSCPETTVLIVPELYNELFVPSKQVDNNLK
jgi:hypothetical protein